MMNNDFLFKKITEKIAEFDFSGYTTQYPPMPLWNKFDLNLVKKHLMQPFLKKPECGLYIHIPFCKTKCSFCRYFSIELKDQGVIDDYLVFLEKEAGLYRKIFKKNKVKTCYIGGGTPSLLHFEQLSKFFDIIYTYFDLSNCAQICFEANPDFLNINKIKLLKQYGVNRLTIGIQSLDPKVIKAVNRTQDVGKIFEIYQCAREIGIKYINIDLMSGLPCQTTTSFFRTIMEVLKWRPDMIHAHPFFPTINTGFSKEGARLSKKDFDRREKMDQLGSKLLDWQGYKKIQFDSMGLTSKARNIQLSDAVEHNTSYIGLGCGATSHVTGYLRYANFNDIEKYFFFLNKNKLPISIGYQLDMLDEMIYFVVAHLRYGEIPRTTFFKNFGKEIDSIFKKEIAYLEMRDKIIVTPSHIISKMKNIGEYLIFSKYFYSQKVVNRIKRKFNIKSFPRKEISEEKMKNMYI